MPTPADLFLSPDLTADQARAYLGSLGFRDPVAVDDHLQKMADDLVVREALGRLAPDLIQSLLESPDPDAAVMALSHYVGARTGRAMFLDYLREDPRALHVLTYVMGASPVLTEILIRTPEYFHWLVSQVERSVPDRQDHEEELASVFSTVDDPAEALNMLRRWKRREMLRIGTRNLLRRDTLQTVAAQLADIACVAVDFTLAIVMRQVLDATGRENPPGTFAVIARGRLGSQEMSYGSEVELLYVYDTPSGDPAGAAAAHEFFLKVGYDLTAALGDETHEGYLYRAGSPPDACSLVEYREHYAGSGDSLERRALMRARPIAGDADLGHRFIACCETFVYGEPLERGESPAVQTPPVFAPTSSDRAAEDIERLTEALQWRHGAAHSVLRHAGTLAVLEAIGRAGLIDEEARRQLDHAYIILRSAEHLHQLGVKEDVEKQFSVSREHIREICRAILQQDSLRD